MSLASSIINTLQCTGLFSGAYLGYRYSPSIKTKLFDYIPRCQELYKSYCSPKLKRANLSDNFIFSTLGVLTGCGIGYYAYPLIVTIFIVQIAEEYPSVGQGWRK
jgi:hypothetical protein